MGRGFVRNFLTRCLYQKSPSLAALTRSISDTSPTRVKIPYAPPAHEVIPVSISKMCRDLFSEENPCGCTPIRDHLP